MLRENLEREDKNAQVKALWHLQVVMPQQLVAMHQVHNEQIQFSYQVLRNN